MDRIALAETLARALQEEQPDLAATLVQAPRATIAPSFAPSSSARAAVDALQALGATLEGRFSLHETLGAGGMGVVHLATQATLGRHVAVKTVRADVHDPNATLSVLQEAWITGALEHPNVVPIYDVGVDTRGEPIIVMKRIAGASWRALMHAPEEITRRFSETDVLEWNLRIFAQVCNAVHFAHSRGILHRDLKPENVMIGAFGEVYVLDWGIAVGLADDPSGRIPSLSRAKEIAGTPSYMAPEMMLAEIDRISERSDVYLLGAVLYEIFAGEPPHGGTELAAIISSVLLSEPKFPQGFPPEARRICERAMARDPANRYPSAEALGRAVADYQRHRGSRRLAHEARASLERLLSTLAEEPADEAQKLTIFNLLGECRFGYRSALAAWPENEVARRELDRALVAVIEHELATGDPRSAKGWLAEVASPPDGLHARVNSATAAYEAEVERLRRLAIDHDRTVGTRTRTFLIAVLGGLWTLIPLIGVAQLSRGAVVMTHDHHLRLSLMFTGVGLALFLWARDTLTKTQVNRRAALSVLAHMIYQTTMGIVAAWGGLTGAQSVLLTLTSFALTESLLAVWLEPWFLLPAASAGASALFAAKTPALLLPLMSLNGLLLTMVLVFVWFPRQDVERMRETRRLLHTKARRWIAGEDRSDRDSARRS
jgi:serine/threonine protein kinase